MSPYRVIRDKDSHVDPTAHLWVIGNSRDSEDAPALGIANSDAHAGAIRERAKFLHRDKIPREDRDESMLDLGKERDNPDHIIFRQAAVARLVEYTRHYGDQGFPEVIPSFADLLEEQATTEQPEWQREWLPFLLVKIPGDPDSPMHLRPTAHDEAVYREYLYWHQHSSAGIPPEKKTVVCRQVCKFYGIKSHQARIPGTKRRVRYYPGYAIAEEAE